MSRLNYLVREPISFVGFRGARRQTLFMGVSSPCFLATVTDHNPLSPAGAVFLPPVRKHCAILWAGLNSQYTESTMKYFQVLGVYSLGVLGVPFNVTVTSLQLYFFLWAKPRLIHFTRPN